MGWGKSPGLPGTGLPLRDLQGGGLHARGTGRESGRDIRREAQVPAAGSESRRQRAASAGERGPTSRGDGLLHQEKVSLQATPHPPAILRLACANPSAFMTAPPGRRRLAQTREEGRPREVRPLAHGHPAGRQSPEPDLPSPCARARCWREVWGPENARVTLAVTSLLRVLRSAQASWPGGRDAWGHPGHL